LGTCKDELSWSEFSNDVIEVVLDLEHVESAMKLNENTKLLEKREMFLLF